MIINPGSSRLHASTIAIDDPGALTQYVDGHGAAFLRGEDGFVAMGEVARLDGATMSEADQWWTQLAADIEKESEMPGLVGTGPLPTAPSPLTPSTPQRPPHSSCPRRLSDGVTG